MMPDWLETMTVVQIVGWLIALGGVVAGLRRLKPIADALHNLVLDWGGEPARDGVPARLGVMARLDALSREIAAVKADTKSAAYNTAPNGGGSSHDTIVKMLAGLQGSVRQLEIQQVAQCNSLRQLNDRLDYVSQESARDRAEIHRIIDIDTATDGAE